MKRIITQQQVMAAIALCLCFLSVSLGQGAGGNSMQPAEENFTCSQAISNGFVFVEGQYLDAPYIIFRNDLAIFINDTLIADYAPLVKELPEPEKLRPARPLNISTNAGPNDPAISEYIYRMQNHLAAKEGRTEAAIEMVSALKALPCIREVHQDPNNDKCAIVTYRNGMIENMGLVPLMRAAAITPASAAGYVSRECWNIMERLEKGNVYSFSEKGNRRHTFSADMSKEVLPNVVSTLRSSQDDEGKAKQLADLLGLAPVPRERTKSFIANLKTSRQLDERVEALTKPPGNLSP